MSRVVSAVRQHSEKPNLVLDFLRQLLQPCLAFIYMMNFFIVLALSIINLKVSIPTVAHHDAY
jgi:hypothetical protein